MRRVGALTSTHTFPSYPPPGGKKWYTTSEGVTIAVTAKQRELALRNLREQGVYPLPRQYDDLPGCDGLGDPIGPEDDPESPGGKTDEYDATAPDGHTDKSSRCGIMVTLLTLLNPIAATGCAGLCLPATTGLLASLTAAFGMGKGASTAIVTYATLLLLYLSGLSLGHSARIRGEWNQYVLGLLSLLVYIIGKAVLRETLVEGLGQILLCASSLWNAWIIRQKTDGGKNCLRAPRYKLKLCRNQPPTKVPVPLIYLFLMVASTAPFTLLIFFEMPP